VLSGYARGVRLSASLLLVPVLGAGLAGAGVAVAGHASDTQFVFRQQHPAQIDPARVAALVGKAPEPVPGTKTRSVSSTCMPGSGSGSGLRNPWTCKVRYASGSRYRYRVQIQSDGRFRGVDRTGQHIVFGCCVKTPAAE
jgi:hypothetical protein